MVEFESTTPNTWHHVTTRRPNARSLRSWWDSGAGERTAEPPYSLAKPTREFTSGEAASEFPTRLLTNPLRAWPLVTASLPKQKHSRAKSLQLRRLKRTQHVVSNNAAICCVGVLRWFESRASGGEQSNPAGRSLVKIREESEPDLCNFFISASSERNEIPLVEKRVRRKICDEERLNLRGVRTI